MGERGRSRLGVDGCRHDHRGSEGERDQAGCGFLALFVIEPVLLTSEVWSAIHEEGIRD